MNSDPVITSLRLAWRAQAKARDVRDGLIEIDGLIRTLDQLAENLTEAVDQSGEVTR